MSAWTVNCFKSTKCSNPGKHVCRLKDERMALWCTLRFKFGFGLYRVVMHTRCGCLSKLFRGWKMNSFFLTHCSLSGNFFYYLNAIAQLIILVFLCRWVQVDWENAKDSNSHVLWRLSDALCSRHCLVGVFHMSLAKETPSASKMHITDGSPWTQQMWIKVQLKMALTENGAAILHMLSGEQAPLNSVGFSSSNHSCKW